jgi:hypothetical protein
MGNWLNYFYVAAGVLVALLARHGSATLYKVKLYMRSLLYLFFTSDSRWKLSDVPDPALLDTRNGWMNFHVL